MPAIRANHVGGLGRAALGAERQLLGPLGVMGPAGTRTRVAMSSFWNSHRTTRKKTGTGTLPDAASPGNTLSRLGASPFASQALGTGVHRPAGAHSPVTSVTRESNILDGLAGGVNRGKGKSQQGCEDGRRGESGALRGRREAKKRSFETRFCAIALRLAIHYTRGKMTVHEWQFIASAMTSGMRGQWITTDVTLDHQREKPMDYRICLAAFCGLVIGLVGAGRLDAG
jgi:hypothetical protein